MLEAVNSVLQSAPLLRPSAERVSPVESFAANPEGAQRGPQAPFISPFVFLDVNHDAAVLQLRNAETGEVVQQIPSESSLEARRRELSREAQPAVHTPTPQRAGDSELAFVQSTVPANQPSPQASASPSSTGGEAGAHATAQQLAAYDAGAKAAAPAAEGSQVGVLA